MKVRMNDTGAVAEVNDSYGLRLIVQGYAVRVPDMTPAPEPEEEE